MDIHCRLLSERHPNHPQDHPHNNPHDPPPHQETAGELVQTELEDLDLGLKNISGNPFLNTITTLILFYLDLIYVLQCAKFKKAYLELECIKSNKETEHHGHRHQSLRGYFNRWFGDRLAHSSPAHTASCHRFHQNEKFGDGAKQQQQ